MQMEQPLLNKLEHFRSEGTPIPRPSDGHARYEAFALMLYASADGSEYEWIWNSRDGVTPFIVFSRSGKEMTHVYWERDRYVPNYKPKSGERIFVDLTAKAAHAYAVEKVERYWEHPEYPMRERYATKEEAIDALVADSMRSSGVDLVEATVEAVEVDAAKLKARLYRYLAAILEADAGSYEGPFFTGFWQNCTSDEEVASGEKLMCELAAKLKKEAGGSQ